MGWRASSGQGHSRTIAICGSYRWGAISLSRQLSEVNKWNNSAQVAAESNSAEPVKPFFSVVGVWKVIGDFHRHNPFRVLET